MRSWAPGQWLAAGIGVVVTALVIGVPTGIVETPFYTRMTPVLWWNYPVWAITSVLSGLVVATYVVPGRPRPTEQKKALAGSLLSVFAVGCPVCNKLVVLILGMSGALTYFAPIQPALAAGSLLLLAEALRRRLRAQSVCPAPRAATDVHEISVEKQ